jgi:arylesterase/paraoxonase
MFAKTPWIVVFLATLLMSCGAPLEKKDMSSCTKISGVPGPEDLDLYLSGNKPTLIISVHNRRTMESIGWLATIDLSLPISEQKPVQIKTNYPENFRPHGISYAKVNGIDTLAVISHTLRKTNPHTIEIFERKQGEEWKHMKTLEDATLTGPNDLFLNTKGEIFASNDRGPENLFMQYVNMIFRHGTADIAYYNGTSFANLNQKVVLGNGIFYRVEDSMEILYRSAFQDQVIYVYKIIRESGSLSLELLKKIELKSGPDNIMPDEQGNLWVATHPSTMKFLSHASSANNKAPAQVFKIEGKSGAHTNVYSNEGDEISAASTALPFGDRIYVSQVFEDFLLTCTKP